MASSRPAALMLSPEAPYPLTGGGAMRTASLLGWLSRRYDVDLIVFREPGRPDPRTALPEGLVRRVTVVPLRTHARHLPARLWRNFGRFLRGAPPLNDRFAGYEAQLRDALDRGGPYDIGVVEHFWCAGYSLLLRPYCRRLVLDLHNIESALHSRSAAVSRGPERLFMQRFASALVRMERSLLPAFDSMLVASEDDAAAASALCPAVPATVYPNAIPSVPRPPAGVEPVLVFSGNLQYYPNRRAVEYFYREIWPMVARKWPALHWRLVGKNPEAIQDIIGGDSRVEVTGPVDDAIAEIARGQVAVVPLLAGSGTRVKILEAWAACVPVVSTPVGAEGLGARDGRDMLIAASPAGFADCVSRLLGSAALREELAAAGRQRYEAEYTWEAAWRRLDAAKL